MLAFWRHRFADKHPNLTAAHKDLEAAVTKITAAQKANEYDMAGHAQKAKELIDQALVELEGGPRRGQRERPQEVALRFGRRWSGARRPGLTPEPAFACPEADRRDRLLKPRRTGWSRCSPGRRPRWPGWCTARDWRPRVSPFATSSWKS